MKEGVKESASELVKSLKAAKNGLVDSKAILKKKDLHAYPCKELFQTPNHWEWLYLSDVSIIQEGPGIRKHQYCDEGVQFLTVTNILEGSVDAEKSIKFISKNEYEDKYMHFTINKGDIVTACSGASWGKSSLFNIDRLMILNTSTLRLRFFNDLGNNKYLYYLTKTDFFKSTLSSHSTGQQANYGYSHYSKIPIPVPPLAEQEAIVEVLDKAFAAIDQAKANLEQNIANAKELFQSKLNQIFSQKGEGWVETTLGECLISQPRNGWSPPAANHAESGIPVLTLSAITGFNFRNEKVKYTSADTDSSRHYWVNNGDLLITRSNTPELVGHVAIAEGIEESTIYPDLIMKMQTDPSCLITKFAYWQLRSPILREVIMGRASGANPTMKKINQGNVKTLPLTIAPLVEQKSIISVLDKLYEEVESIKSHYQTKLASLDELKKSILQKAFAGELT